MIGTKKYFFLKKKIQTRTDDGSCFQVSITHVTKSKNIQLNIQFESQEPRLSNDAKYLK